MNRPASRHTFKPQRDKHEDKEFRIEQAKSCFVQLSHKTVKTAVARKPSRVPSNWQMRRRILSSNIRPILGIGTARMIVLIADRCHLDPSHAMILADHTGYPHGASKSLSLFLQAKTNSSTSAAWRVMAHESIPQNGCRSAGLSISVLPV